MSRIYFLDNLRVPLAVLVVLDHASQPYGNGAAAWPIPAGHNSPIDALVLGLFTSVIVSFFMGLFFMISAYFMPSSLERKGAAKFMKDRLVKLGVPILIFMIGVFPLMGYLLLGQPYITLGHLWFLEVLLILSAVYVAYWWVSKPSSKAKRAFPDTAAILTFIVAMALMSFVVRIWAPENYWLPLGLFEPFHIIQYVMLFIAGLIAFKGGWIDAVPKAAARLWSRVAVLMVISLPVVIIVTNGTQFSGGLTAASLLGSFWEAFMCVSMCIALLALFKNRFNSHGPITRALAKNTYTVYLIQLPIVIFLQYILIAVTIDPLIKFAIVGALGVLLSFAISHYVIRRLPYAKYVLG
jgi:glucan biosynthesis protein C